MTSDSASPVIQKIAEAVPEFGEVWKQHEASPYYHPGEPYTDFSQLAHFVVELGRTDSDAQLARIFQIVEDALAEADAVLGEAIVVGFLEDVQNIALNTTVPLSKFESLLGPLTERGWRAIERLWDGETKPGEFKRFVEEERWRVPPG